MIRIVYGTIGTRRVLSKTNDELIVRPLQTNERYIAISHTWGEDRNIIQGIEWSVASWISYQTCKALVDEFGNIWIDSLCIKQDDNSDLNEQIKDMRNIYRDAKDVVVVLTGNYHAQLGALRRLKELLETLATQTACTLSRDCPYVRTMEEIRDAAVVIREMAWFRRVWTLQEAIIPEFLTFVGFEGDILQLHVTTMEELEELTFTYDEVSDVKSRAFAGSLTHPSCIENIIEPLSVAADLRGIMDSIRPIYLWVREGMKGREVEYVAETVFRQLDSRNRACREINDLVYGVCAVLEIEVEVDYQRSFEDVFIDAVKQLVRRGVCVLPQTPCPGHGDTWLPNLEHINLRDAWGTVKSKCVLSEAQNRYHDVLCKGTRIVAKGRLIQMCDPHLIRTSITAVANTLEAMIRAARTGKDFDDGSIDPSLLTITCLALWIHRNFGNDDLLTISQVESIIHSLYSDKRSEELVLAVPHTAADNTYSISSIVKDVLETSNLLSTENNPYRNMPLQGRDAILVCKRKVGFVLYSAPSSVQTGSAYGFFYKRCECARVREIICNILVRRNDGIWDNQGEARCWYISRSWDICKREVPVGTLP